MEDLRIIELIEEDGQQVGIGVFIVAGLLVIGGEQREAAKNGIVVRRQANGDLLLLILQEGLKSWFNVAGNGLLAEMELLDAGQVQLDGPLLVFVPDDETAVVGRRIIFQAAGGAESLMEDSLPVLIDVVELLSVPQGLPECGQLLLHLGIAEVITDSVNLFPDGVKRQDVDGSQTAQQLLAQVTGQQEVGPSVQQHGLEPAQLMDRGLIVDGFVEE